MLTYSLLAGLLFGLYFSLIGLGLNLVFGVMRIVNLAHGDFLMLGAFLAFWLFTLFALNPVAGDRDRLRGVRRSSACRSITSWCRGCCAPRTRKCCRSFCSSACRR